MRRRAGLWHEATSTTGGTIAVVVAAALAGLLLLGLLGLTGLVAARAVATHHGVGPLSQLRQGDGPLDGKRRNDAGPRRLPGPLVPRGNGGSGLDGMGGLMAGALGLGEVQHGALTVQDNGTPTVVTVQRGAVTAASAGSVTVKSQDGFSATYAITADTRGNLANLAKGDTVLVVARKSGSQAVLVRVVRRS